MEFAIVLIPLLAILFGIIQYGMIFFIQNQLTEAASDAARAAVPYELSALEANDDQLANTLMDAHVDDGLLPSCDSGALTCTASFYTCSGSDTCLRVVMSYDYKDSPLAPLPLPRPSTIRASSTVLIGSGS